jgi:AcrR family transcriptional regulator
MLSKTRLNRAAVVQAAADLVNQAGAESLTLSRLADRLGIRPPSLYNHISSLDDLYRQLAMVNARQLGERLAGAAIGKSGLPAMRAIAQAYRAYIKENPGLYTASLRASRNQDPVDAELTAAEDRAVQVVMAVTASFDLDGEEALHAIRGLRSLVHGFATLEIAGGFGLPLDCDESFRRLVEIYTSGLQASGAGKLLDGDER